MNIVCIVPSYIIFDYRNRTSINSFLKKLFASNFCYFVHCQHHGFSGFFLINFRYPCLHNMDSAKDYFALLLTTTKTGKGLLDSIGLGTALVQEKISRKPSGAFVLDKS